MRKGDKWMWRVNFGSVINKDPHVVTHKLDSIKKVKEKSEKYTYNMQCPCAKSNQLCVLEVKF